MSEEFEIHYHGTTINRLDLILYDELKVLGRIDLKLTGAWTTRILENSIKHAIKRGKERREKPVVIEYKLPKWWVKKYNYRSQVNVKGYDENVHCFIEPIPPEYFVRNIFPHRNK